MTKRDQPEPNLADLRGWAAKKLEDYELALRHVDDAPVFLPLYGCDPDVV